MAVTQFYILISLYVFFCWLLAGVLSQGAAGHTQPQAGFVWLMGFLSKNFGIRSRHWKIFKLGFPACPEKSEKLDALGPWCHEGPSAEIKATAPFPHLLEGWSHAVQVASGSTTPYCPTPGQGPCHWPLTMCLWVFVVVLIIMKTKVKWILCPWCRQNLRKIVNS